jgi:hypothetical protein
MQVYVITNLYNARTRPVKVFKWILFIFRWCHIWYSYFTCLILSINWNYLPIKFVTYEVPYKAQLSLGLIAGWHFRMKDTQMGHREWNYHHPVQQWRVVLWSIESFVHTTNIHIINYFRCNSLELLKYSDQICMLDYRNISHWTNVRIFTAKHNAGCGYCWNCLPFPTTQCNVILPLPHISCSRKSVQECWVRITLLGSFAHSWCRIFLRQLIII